MKKENIKISQSEFNKAVVEAVEQFDFQKVFNYMKSVNWFWATISDDNYIPSPKMLKSEVVKLFDQIWKEDKTGVSTGGFHCGIENDDIIFITFTCEEVSNDVEPKY